MPFATCTVCGRETFWRASRGARLSLLRCSFVAEGATESCGGRLRGGRVAYVSPLRGEKQARCAVCRKTGYLGRGLVTFGVEVPFYAAVPNERRGGTKLALQLLPAGSPICWSLHWGDVLVRRLVEGVMLSGRIDS